MIERVSFAKPLLAQLNEEGYKCIDMHFHSKYSDTYTRIDNILKKCRKLGIGVAITDHNNVQGCIDAQRENKKYGADVINGIEISTKQGPHILAYFYNLSDLARFYDDYVKDYKRKSPYTEIDMAAEEIADGIKENNGIISVAHPRAISKWDLQRKVDKGEICVDILKQLDCVEVICGLILRKMNVRALKWAHERKMGITGGSDGHTLSGLGSVVAYSKADTVDSFLDSVRKNRNFVVGTETRMLPRMYSYSKALPKHSRYAGHSLGHYKTAITETIGNIKEKMNNHSGIKP